MLIGAHVSSAGGIDKAIDRAVELGADSVQVFTQSPRAWRPTNHDPASFERFREKRAEAGIGGVLCHAVYLVNLASPDPVVYEKLDRGDAQHDGGRPPRSARTASSSTSGRISAAASRRGSSTWCPRSSRCSSSATDETWLLMENSAGAGRHDRPLDRGARRDPRAARRHPRLGVCLDSCHLWVSGVDVTDPAALDACLDEVDPTIGLDRLRALHVNDAAAPFGSNRDRHANVLEGELGEKLGVFLSNPRLQGLPAVLETAGPENRGPDANEIRKTKELARALAHCCVEA